MFKRSYSNEVFKANDDNKDDDCCGNDAVGDNILDFTVAIFDADIFVNMSLNCSGVVDNFDNANVCCEFESCCCCGICDCDNDGVEGSTFHSNKQT